MYLSRSSRYLFAFFKVCAISPSDLGSLGWFSRFLFCFSFLPTSRGRTSGFGSKTGAGVGGGGGGGGRDGADELEQEGDVAGVEAAEEVVAEDEVAGEEVEVDGDDDEE